jgi:hypothetical protein
MKHVTWIALLALAASTASIARAEERPTLLADHRPGSPAGAVELGLGWYTDSDMGSSIHVLRPTLGARLAFSEHAELTLDWPFAFGILSPAMGDGDTSFRTGNPVAAIYYMRRSEAGYYRIGGAIAVPLADVGDSALTSADAFTAVLTYGGASAMNGLWNIWQYSVDRLSLVIPGQFERRSGHLIYGGDLGLGILIDTGDANRDAELVLQLAGMIGGRVDNVSLGTRLQVVWLATQDGGDNAQLALVPFVQADFSDNGFLFMRFVLNLDEPLGVFGDGAGLLGKVWGLHIGGGTRF